MRLGIVGKGGVGKTTISALLAQAYAERGRRVVAIDTDSNPNLGISLGLTVAESEAVPVLPRSLVVGSGSETSAREVIDTYGRDTPAGVTLLSGIRVTDAGAGCTCTGHVSVRSFLGDVLLAHADVTLVDMEAGLEHLSRSGGTLAYADALLMVIEPSLKSVLTAARTQALAAELGIPRVYGVGNKARLPRDRQFFSAAAAEHGVPLAAVVPYDEDVVAADRRGEALGPGQATSVREAVAAIIDLLDSEDTERQALLRERDRVHQRIAELEASR